VTIEDMDLVNDESSVKRRLVARWQYRLFEHEGKDDGDHEDALN
jgi:hypothetical protein